MCIFSLLYKVDTHFRGLQVSPIKKKKKLSADYFFGLIWFGFYRYYRNFGFSRCKWKHILLQGFSNWCMIPKVYLSVLYWASPSCIWIFTSFWFFLCLSLTDFTHDKIKLKRKVVFFQHFLFILLDSVQVKAQFWEDKLYSCLV